jgi:hypothetical protein
MFLYVSIHEAANGRSHSETTDPSISDVRIANLISGRIFASASLYAAQSAPTDAP